MQRSFDLRVVLPLPVSPTITTVSLFFTCSIIVCFAGKIGKDCLSLSNWWAFCFNSELLVLLLPLFLDFLCGCWWLLVSWSRRFLELLNSFLGEDDDGCECLDLFIFEWDCNGSFSMETMVWKFECVFEFLHVSKTPLTPFDAKDSSSLSPLSQEMSDSPA